MSKKAESFWTRPGSVFVGAVLRASWGASGGALMGLGASWKRLVGVLLPMFSVFSNVFWEPLLDAFYCGDDKCHAFRARFFFEFEGGFL